MTKCPKAAAGKLLFIFLLILFSVWVRCPSKVMNSSLKRQTERPASMVTGAVIRLISRKWLCDCSVGKAGLILTRKKEIDRDRILDAAERVILESGGRNFTLDAVAERAGISKGGLVYSFPTKDGA